MKHAIMIMAHKNFEFLHHLIEYFSRDCYVFVHIDKKSTISREEEACLLQMPQVSGVYRKYSVHWGGFSILKCELFLMKEALRSCDADYFHLISGQDYPIKPLSYFLQFFEENKGKEFLQYVHLPHPKWDSNTFRRFQYFYPFDYMERNHKTFQRVRKFIDWQKRFGIKRRIPDCFNHLYGSSQWFSITRNATTILLNYTKDHPRLFCRLKYTFAPEESYIATILINIQGTKNVVERNLRYIRWKNENGSLPATLSEEHFLNLIKSPAFFARKFETPLSNELLSRIDRYLLHDKDITFQPDGSRIYEGYLKYEYNKTLMAIIGQLYFLTLSKTIVEIGCGAGIYVASWRINGIPVIGYDTNPYSAQLSSLILPKGDALCRTYNFFNNTEFNQHFDMVICLDFMRKIPPCLVDIAIRNICEMSNRHVVVSIREPCMDETKKHVVDMYKENHFYLEETASKYFSSLLKQEEKNQFLLIFKTERYETN